MTDETTTTKEYKTVPITAIAPNPWNPNVEEDDKFNLLGESIRSTGGLIEPLTLVRLSKPLKDRYPDWFDKFPSAKYVIISGEHRWRASDLLGIEKEVPALIVDGLEQDLLKFLTVRMNVIRGKLDPLKLANLLQGLDKKYDREITKTLLGFTDEVIFDKVFEDVRASVPEEIKDKLDEARKDITSVDDLSRILNNLFTQYGNSLKWSYMFFTFGGKRHVMVQTKADLWKEVESITRMCSQEQKDAGEVFYELIKDWKAKKLFTNPQDLSKPESGSE